MKYKKSAFFIVILLAVMTLQSGISRAQSLCANGEGYVDRPAGGHGITSNFGPRNCAGCSSNHPGTDYGTPCGTKVSGPPKGCVKVSSGSSTAPQQAGNPSVGWGYRARFDCGTNSAGQRIQIQYAHLNDANSYSPGSNLITTGNSGAGGCHLDFIITVDGTAVDAQCATGIATDPKSYKYGNSSTRHGKACPSPGTKSNLCDGNVTNKLVEHAKQVRGNANKINMPTAGNDTAPQPPNGSTGGENGSSSSGSGSSGSSSSGSSNSGSSGSGGAQVGEEPQPDPEKTLNPEPEAASKYEQNPTKVICDNSTCITQSSIDVAKHKDVKSDKVKTHVKLINPPESGKCEGTAKTGTTVYRQIFDENDVGDTLKYPDTFCINQGCSYVNKTKSGAGKCE